MCRQFVRWQVLDEHRPERHMVSEFDLPCADCGQELVRRQVDRAGDALTVAECPCCGGRYYPEQALSRL
ncbi:hypothetical protein BRC78_03570 [Halobacteriales archaeon QH_8_68_33]|nr:MAG: hypothetical protein BRC78_03570 [Halobacteriales archaeon QH_8_68_33]